MITQTPWTCAEVIGSHQRKWSIDAEGIDEHVATLWGNGHDAKANAAFIVKAVNCHEELLKTSKALYLWMKTGNAPDMKLGHILSELRKAITQAEGK